MISLGTIVFIVIVCLFVFFGLVVFVGAPYVPSQRKYIRRAFDYFGVGKDDTLVDIGSGDGVVLRVASRYGATSVGYEINPILVFLARMFSASDRNVTVLLQNAWTATFPDTVTIVYVFAVQRDERKLIHLVQREADRLQRPLRLICFGSPFKHMEAVDVFEAYHLYIFQPLQVKNA